MVDSQTRWALVKMVLAIAVIAGPFTPTRAQRVAATNAEPKRELPHISVSLDDVPLATAIQSIAQHAGLIPIYDASLIPDRARVTLRVRDVTVTDAFSQALRGTGLVARMRAEGQVVIARATAADTVARGEIVGTVTDASTKHPIAGATVTLDRARAGVVTDAHGGFRLTSVTAGSHTVTVRRLGYQPSTLTIQVKDDLTTKLDVILNAAAAATLDQVVVTGTVVATERRALPNAITVITARQLEEMGITRIDQLFRGNVPGVYVQNLGAETNYNNEPNGVNMYVRGSTTLQGVDSPPIKTYIDGVEMANPRMLATIDPKSIERIEIVTGPQASTIYGSGALGGVMQIFTKRGGRMQRRPEVTLSASYSMLQNDFSGSLAPRHDDAVQVSYGGDNASYNAGVHYQYEGQWTPGRTISTWSGFAGTHHESGPFAVELNGRVYHGTYGNPSVPQDMLENVASGVYAYTSQVIPVERMPYTSLQLTGGGNLAYRPWPWWRTQAVLGIDRSANEQKQLTPQYTSYTDSSQTLTQTTAMRRTISINSTMDVPLGPHLRSNLTVGGDGTSTESLFMYGGGTEIDNLTNLMRTRTPDHNVGYYVQGQLGMWDHVFLTAGVRAERNPNYGKDYGTNYSDRYGVAVNQQFGDLTMKFRVAYGRATRPPQMGWRDGQSACSVDPGICDFYTQFFGPNVYFILPAPLLAPERQRGPEGGFELYLGSWLSLSITHYRQRVDDLIIMTQGVDSVASLLGEAYGYAQEAQYQNVGRVNNTGWESQGSATFGPLTVTGTYSWTKSRIGRLNPSYVANSNPNNFQFQDGGSFTGLAEHTGALQIGYAAGRSTINLNVVGTGQVLRQHQSFTFFGLYRLGAYLPVALDHDYIYAVPGRITDVTLNVEHSIGRHTLFANVRNLTNFYRNDGFRTTSPTLGRQTELGMRLKY